MSLIDYQATRRIPGDMPFDALIMAAVLRADSVNRRQLRAAFPQLVAEAEARYNAPGGRLPDDPEGGAR